MTEKQHQQSSIAYLSDNNPHRVYLTTYPHLDKEKFPTREKFGKACASAFGRNNVLYFACSREPHKVTNAEHYHAIIRLNPSQRWKTEKEFSVKTTVLLLSLPFYQIMACMLVHSNMLLKRTQTSFMVLS